MKLGLFYLPWYVKQWRQWAPPKSPELRHPQVFPLLRYAERTSRRLARRTLYAMMRFRASFLDEQLVQTHLEAIGEELLAIIAAALNAERQTRIDGHTTVWELVDSFCADAKRRIDRHFSELRCGDDDRTAKAGTQALKGYFPTLSDGIIRRRLTDYLPKDRSSI
jgi:hypothetical protein